MTKSKIRASSGVDARLRDVGLLPTAPNYSIFYFPASRSRPASLLRLPVGRSLVIF
jgi:hypothetical protein